VAAVAVVVVVMDVFQVDFLASAFVAVVVVD
jgi:hypothetical protein